MRASETSIKYFISDKWKFGDRHDLIFSTKIKIILVCTNFAHTVCIFALSNKN